MNFSGLKMPIVFQKYGSTDNSVIQDAPELPENAMSSQRIQSDSNMNLSKRIVLVGCVLLGVVGSALLLSTKGTTSGSHTPLAAMKFDVLNNVAVDVSMIHI